MSRNDDVVHGLKLRRDRALAGTEGSPVGRKLEWLALAGLISLFIFVIQILLVWAWRWQLVPNRLFEWLCRKVSRNSYRPPARHALFRWQFV